MTQWYPPEPAGPAYAPAAGLAQRGHDVTVLTGFPNYPTGRIYDGYRQRPHQIERGADGITVHRVPQYPSHDSGAAKRMASYVSFAASASVAAQILPPADVWVTYSSPATAALPRLLQRPGRRTPHFLILQDLWPDSVTESGFVTGAAGQIIHRGLDVFCRTAYRDASGIGIISLGMREALTARGVPESKIFDTPNWVEDRTLRGLPRSREALGLPATGRIFLYAGNLGDFQALDELIDAFSDVDAHLVLMGSGVRREELAHRIEATGQSNIHLLPAVPPDTVSEYYAAADIVVVSLQDLPLLRVTMPSKVQASLAAGRPIFAHACGDVATVVENARAGLSGAPGTAAARGAVQELARASDDELSQMGLHARRWYDAHYAPEAGLDRLETALLTIAGGTQ